MALTISISAISGVSPYDVYVCQSGGTSCFYISEITSVPYTFEIPIPYDQSTSYMVKIVDAEGCSFNSIQSL